MERLIYISESRITATDAEKVVAQVVAVSQSRNADLEISGALLFTGTHFAQILEGPSKSISLLMSALRNDARHSNIFIAARFSIRIRIFSGWQMAYYGPSQYVARFVHQLLPAGSSTDQRRTAERLTQLFLEFVRPIGAS